MCQFLECNFLPFLYSIIGIRDSKDDDGWKRTGLIIGSEKWGRKVEIVQGLTDSKEEANPNAYVQCSIQNVRVLLINFQSDNGRIWREYVFIWLYFNETHNCTRISFPSQQLFRGRQWCICIRPSFHRISDQWHSFRQHWIQCNYWCTMIILVIIGEILIIQNWIKTNRSVPPSKHSGRFSLLWNKSGIVRKLQGPTAYQRSFEYGTCRNFPVIAALHWKKTLFLKSIVPFNNNIAKLAFISAINFLRRYIQWLHWFVRRRWDLPVPFISIDCAFKSSVTI